MEKADDVKARLILEKLAEDEAKMKAQDDMLAHLRKQEQSERDFTESMKGMQVQAPPVISLGYQKSSCLNDK